jgi:nitroimidazol reductase NimA-like FMN-containing flavoprotein (pyridoxamine 5'-phosphate oxidase superfamily)
MEIMRRKDKALGESAVQQLLINGEYGVLATVDADGRPYGVPLNYVYMNDCVYFHCATVGHKLENISADERVSFTVVGRTEVLAAEFSTGFESVIAFGRAALVDGDERYRALIGLLEKYSADYLEEGRKYIEKLDKQTAVVRVSLDSVTGKAKMTDNMQSSPCRH